ncbi:MAG: hypothetical protein HY038_05670 [Nitrospirae bacterium]|nr:hypothetical protein [Nitrospirota bacterium]
MLPILFALYPGAKVRLVYASVACLVTVLVALAGCSNIFTTPSLSQSKVPVHHSQIRTSTIDRLAPVVQPEIRLQIGAQAQTVLAAHATATDVPARHKRRIALQTLTDPWTGFSTLEHQGLLLVELAEGGSENLPAILDVMEAAADRTSEYFKPVPFPATITQKGILEFITDTLEEASIQRDKALANLSDDERTFLFMHAKTVTEHFGPPSETGSADKPGRAKLDARFTQLINEQVDYAALIASAQVLARFANERWLQQLAVSFQHTAPIKQTPPGITGDVLFTQETKEGLIVIGGTGPNTYDLDSRMVLVVDVGGDDTYRGMIASSPNIDHGNSIVVDLGGNDAYTSDPLGLATGRLGVGLLIDQAGNDVYQLGIGSGGTGFGGLGILFDRQGNDLYMGSRFTQAAAVGGLGLLIDVAGNDRYTSHGFAIGFGGPLGIGAVLDLAGDDTYQCGDKYPSPFNQQESPNARPGDPQFQYLCYGLGAASGIDHGGKKTDQQQMSLAGGLGYLIDVKGQDQYRSGNSALGAGSFFGVGVAIDLSGNDEYSAARLGLGASMHYGSGLLLDHQGDDRYRSSGPRSNLAAAADHSASLALDAGVGRDNYDLSHSSGLGLAERWSWALFLDEGGDDSYDTSSGLGQGTKESLGQFVDLAGNDQYGTTAGKTESPSLGRGNGRTLTGPGSLFLDR